MGSHIGIWCSLYAYKVASLVLSSDWSDDVTDLIMWLICGILHVHV